MREKMRVGDTSLISNPGLKKRAAGARKANVIRVLIAEDHTVVRDGIRAVLQREAGEFRVVAEAADVPTMIREVREHKPDLLTLDLTMPGGSSLAALPTIGAAGVFNHTGLTSLIVRSSLLAASNSSAS